MWYLVPTIILYSVGAFIWLLFGGCMSLDDYTTSSHWKAWRASLPIGLVTIWTWPVTVPVAIIWFLGKFTKDAFDIIRERNN